MATAPTEAASQTNLDLDRVAAAYIRMRDTRSAMTREYEARDAEIKAKMATLEAAMLGQLNTHGIESVRTASGTIYKQENLIPNIVDDEAFFAWIKANDAFEAMERRVKKTFIADFQKSHDGLLPPGINAHREFVIRVRKPS